MAKSLPSRRSSACGRLIVGLDVAANVTAIVPLALGLAGFFGIKVAAAIVKEAVIRAGAR